MNPITHKPLPYPNQTRTSRQERGLTLKNESAFVDANEALNFAKYYNKFTQREGKSHFLTKKEEREASDQTHQEETLSP